MEQYRQLAWEILNQFLLLVDRFWPLLALLVLLHLAYALWSSRSGGEQTGDLPDDQNIVAALTQRGFVLEKELYRGRLGADYIFSGPVGRVYIQVKRWKKRLGDRPVMDLSETRMLHRCDSAVLIAERGFSRAAREAAGSLGIYLWTTRQLAAELDSWLADSPVRDVAAERD